MQIRCVSLVAAALCGASAQDTRHVTEPKIPHSCTVLTANLSAQGTTLADADETKLDTERIQQALDHCPAGQAVELKSAGNHNAFLAGPLDLRQGVTLLIDRGVILFASRNPRDYDVQPGVCGTITEGGRGCKALLNGNHVSDAAVMGEGIIDGRGGYKILGQNITWWDLAEKARAGGTQNNPRLLVLTHCGNFTLYRIQLRNSPNFHVSYSHGNGFTAWGVIVNSPQDARNTDGIDPGNSTNVTITHCMIHTGDDNVAIKAGAGEPTTHMTVAHNHFYGGHGMSIGSNTDGGASAIRVQDLSIDGADNGLRIKSNITRGGDVHDIEYDDVCIRNTAHPILMDSNYTASVGKTRDKPPHFTDIRLKNVRVIGEGKVKLEGLDEQHRLGIQFDNVFFNNAESIKLTATHADITTGPGQVNLRMTGAYIDVHGKPGKSTPNACVDKFVPFPMAVSTKPK
ncbi:MAG TPA: glycosyl hydrolase family 28 protein [Bryobacteraceae bacterium]|nr:glycosyl hydrolase family 28 protein [Bryobacteraceae bacterium]